MKIFVTVGTAEFDELFQKMDQILKADPELEAVGQIGSGDYKPRNFSRVFRLTGKTEKYYKWADLIVSHGGAGTIYDILKSGKRAIAVPNKKLIEDHQVELVDAFSKMGYIMKGDLASLGELIKDASSYRFQPYNYKPHKIGWVLKRYIDSLNLSEPCI